MKYTESCSRCALTELESRALRTASNLTFSRNVKILVDMCLEPLVDDLRL